MLSSKNCCPYVIHTINVRAFCIHNKLFPVQQNGYKQKAAGLSETRCPLLHTELTHIWSETAKLLWCIPLCFEKKPFEMH